MKKLLFLVFVSFCTANMKGAEASSSSAHVDLQKLKKEERLSAYREKFKIDVQKSKKAEIDAAEKTVDSNLKRAENLFNFIIIKNSMTEAEFFELKKMTESFEFKKKIEFFVLKEIPLPLPDQDSLSHLISMISAFKKFKKKHSFGYSSYGMPEAQDYFSGEDYLNYLENEYKKNYGYDYNLDYNPTYNS